MRIANPIARFGRDESGSVTLEALFMFPLLMWVLMATLVFFQAFHVQSLNLKVTYTLGDILSREDMPVTPEYIDSLYALQGTMTGSPEPRLLRVTAVTFADGAYRKVWSQVRGDGVTAHTDASLAQIADASLPVMSAGQVTILTESWQDHTPLFVAWVGLEPLTFFEIMPTQPRAPQVCWNDNNDPSAWTEANTVCDL